MSNPEGGLSDLNTTFPHISVPQDPASSVRPPSTSELPEFPTPTPSRSFAPRAASSREPEAGELPEATRSKMSSVDICRRIVVITLSCVIHQIWW